jgi:hypothetical protein
VRLLESSHKRVHTDLNVLTHEIHFHTKRKEWNGDRSVTYKLMFNVDSITNDCTYAGRGCRVDKMIV